MYDEEESVCFNFCRGNSLENLQGLSQHIDALIFINITSMHQNHSINVKFGSPKGKQREIKLHRILINIEINISRCVNINFTSSYNHIP